MRNAAARDGAKLFQKKRSTLDFSRRRKTFPIEKVYRALILIVEVAAVLVLSYFVVQGFGIRVNILGNSMEPALYEGDFVFVNRVAYKVGSPHHNDIVVFLPSGNLNAQYSVKRVVGVPGDTVYITGGNLYVNDEIYHDIVETDSISDAGRAETPLLLGEDEYFLLGDNRNSSEDSRYETIGNVSKEELYGKAWLNINRSRRDDKGD